jgi:hypothetical protein
MSPIVRMGLLGVLSFVRTGLWLTGTGLLVLLTVVASIEPNTPHRSFGGRIQQTWNGAVALIDLGVLRDRHAAAALITQEVDPECRSALGRVVYRSVVRCGASCRSYPRPTCAFPQRSP